ncbi:MAG: hypothetical protein GEV07_07275 [Streptosporangiales bacterium]|nr:hypothetical protein [Streptosporangiales bacterium]
MTDSTHYGTEALLTCYERMYRIRQFESTAEQLYRAGELLGFLHSCTIWSLPHDIAALEVGASETSAVFADSKNAVAPHPCSAPGEAKHSQPPSGSP